LSRRALRGGGSTRDLRAGSRVRLVDGCALAAGALSPGCQRSRQQTFREPAIR
jgi:hypothetical protein